jgi:hypothetical protein
LLECLHHVDYFEHPAFLKLYFSLPMHSPEFQSQLPEVRRAIDDVDSLHIPNYANYGTSASLDAHFVQLAQEAERGGHPGLTITRQPVGPRGGNLVKTVFGFDESGFAAMVMMRPHRDELVGLRMAERLASMVRHRRELFVSRGVGQVVALDVTSDDSGNDWHFGEHTLGNYLLGSDRGEDHDWRYPTSSGGFTKTTPNSEAGRQVIDEERPRVLDPQHNANIGSYWAYLENGPSGLAQAQSEFMQEVNHGLPPSPPDDPDPEVLAEGVYRLRTWAEMVPSIYGPQYTQEQLDAYGDNPIHYAGRKYGTIGSIYEQALLTYEALKDNDPSQLHREALGTALRKGLDVVSFVEEVLGRAQPRENDPGWSLYNTIRFSAMNWRQELLPEFEALQSGKIENPFAMATGAQVADFLVRKHAAPAKLLGSLGQLTTIDDSFRHFKDEVVDRTGQEAGYLTGKLKLTAAKPSDLVRARVASFLLVCESAHKSQPLR